MVLGGVNRLIQSDSVVYHYDAENQRIGVNQTQYVINSQPALSQVLVQEENGQKTFYVYGLGLIGQEVDGEYTSYHFDFRGSTVALTDKDAQIVEQYQYSPYGLLLSGDSSKTPFLFNGMYGVMTDSNNLYYMRARFYSPEIKRFINQDILLGGIGEGQTLNRYAFVTGDPIKYNDPYGLHKFDDFFGLPKQFWKWFHKHPDMKDLKEANGQVPEDIAKSFYEEWLELGKPKSDNKGRNRQDKGFIDPELLLDLLGAWGLLFIPTEFGCSVLDCNGNGIPDHMEISCP